MKNGQKISIGIIALISLIGFIPFISASWNNDLNNGLIAYWNFDNASAQVNDSVYHLYPYSLTPIINSSGYIGNGTFMNGTNGMNWNIGSYVPEMQLNTTGLSITINFWYNPFVTSTVQKILDNRYDTGWFVYKYSNDKIYTDMTPTEYSSTSAIPLNTWSMITVIKNSTSVCTFINAVIDNCINDPRPVPTNNHFMLNKLSIGAEYDGSRAIYGGLDEVGIWIRELNYSEMENLYSNITWHSTTNETNITIPPITPPVTPTITGNSIYTILASTGAGIGIFFQMIAIALPVLIIGIAMAVIIGSVGYSIAYILKSMKGEK
jgi:hypothetical protein